LLLGFLEGVLGYFLATRKPPIFLPKLPHFSSKELPNDSLQWRQAPSIAARKTPPPRQRTRTQPSFSILRLD